MAQDICEVASGFRSFSVAKTWDSAGLICASSFSISLSSQLCSPFQAVTSRCLDVRTVEESRQSNSRSSLIDGQDEPPASGQQIMQQEAQLHHQECPIRLGKFSRMRNYSTSKTATAELGRARLACSAINTCAASRDPNSAASCCKLRLKLLLVDQLAKKT